MYGQHPRRRRRGGPPPPPPQPQFYYQNPNLNSNLLLLPLLQCAFTFQNLTVPIHNTNFPVQNPNINPKPIVSVKRFNKAVNKARTDLVAAGENVCTWKVSQSALLMLKADSWESLGFQMQHVPALHRLMVTEGKINAFIHCFLGVQNITSLYDLELAICKNEGTEKFEELNLGPLLRHPLIIHYFGATSDVKVVFKITSVEIIHLLSSFIKKKHKDLKADEFLEFIAKTRSVDRKELLGVRIQRLEMLVTQIHQGRNSEQAAVKKYLGNTNTISVKESRKRPQYPSQNANSSDRVGTCPFPSVSEQMTRHGLTSDAGPRSSPASTLINNDSRPLKRKRKSENSITGTPTSQLPKRDEVKADPLAKNKLSNLSSKAKKKQQRFQSPPNELDLSREINSIRKFIMTWREACRENNVTEVLDRMMQFYNPKRVEKVKAMFMNQPCAELLNVAVDAIRTGLCDSMYDTFQTLNKQGMSNPFPFERDQLSISTVNAERTYLTGRLGEVVAFRYFLEKYGGTSVKWVNETHETGFPYDIVVGDDETCREFIEVKATKSSSKYWFNISPREWQFAVEKGECYSIAHIALQANNMANNMARVTVYKNPARLCQLSQLELAILIPGQHRDVS